MLHFKNALPAPFPLLRYEVKATGKGDYIVWDNGAKAAIGKPMCWDDAHTVAEHMERSAALSAAAEALPPYDESDFDYHDGSLQERERHLVTGTRGHSYVGGV